MNKVAKTPWWASIGFGRHDAKPDSDYADMGTAFGLDASLSPDEGAIGVGEPDSAASTQNDRSFSPRR